MKKIVLSIVGSIAISLCAVHAQQSDTAGAAQNDQQWQQQDRSQHQDAYANEGMVVVDKDELPASLRETLQDQKYEGWENATIYHNTHTGEYVIAPHAYRFDKDGREIDMGHSTEGYDHPQGASQQDAHDQAQEQMGEIPTSAPETSDQDQGTEEQFRTQGMVEIQAEQIPASLRRTLSERQYSGWEESGTLYQDPSSNGYVLVMDKGDNASQPQVYRFDKNGQLNDEGQK